MILQNKHNRLEIWSGRYINRKFSRDEFDRELQVYQIEPIPNKTDYYMVEVGKPEEN